jgi:hypothetical protein
MIALFTHPKMGLVTSTTAVPLFSEHCHLLPPSKLTSTKDANIVIGLLS